MAVIIVNGVWSDVRFIALQGVQSWEPRVVNQLMEFLYRTLCAFLSVGFRSLTMSLTLHSISNNI
jgi:hypothetical protein